MDKEFNDRTVVMIVNPPGELQIGLQALLTSHLDVDVLAVSKLSSALKAIDRQKPSLVILDQDISRKEIAAAAKKIKTAWPEILCLVLVNDERGREVLVDSSVDLVLVKGLKGIDLVDMIRMLLKNQKDEI